jgi:hypothetical protein
MALAGLSELALAVATIVLFPPELLFILSCKLSWPLKSRSYKDSAYTDHLLSKPSTVHGSTVWHALATFQGMGGRGYQRFVTYCGQVY